MTFLHALPAIALISLMMWTAIGAVGFVLGSFINAEEVGMIIVAVVLAPVAIWSTFHVIRLAMAAERYPDR